MKNKQESRLQLILRGNLKIKPLPYGELATKEKLRRIACWWTGGHYYVVDEEDNKKLMSGYDKVLVVCDRCGKCAYLER